MTDYAPAVRRALDTLAAAVGDLPYVVASRLLDPSGRDERLKPLFAALAVLVQADGDEQEAALAQVHAAAVEMTPQVRRVVSMTSENLEVQPHFPPSLVALYDALADVVDAVDRAEGITE